MEVLDAVAAVWLDRNGLITSSRTKGQANQDPSLELLLCCHHDVASIDIKLYVYGCLRGGMSSRLYTIVEFYIPFRTQVHNQLIPLLCSITL